MNKTEEFRTKVGVYLTLLITATDYQAVAKIGEDLETYLNGFKVENAVEAKIKDEALEASSSIVAINFAGDDEFIQFIEGKVEERRAANPLHDLETMLGYATTGRTGTRVDLTKVLDPETYRELMKEATEARREAYNN